MVDFKGFKNQKITSRVVWKRILLLFEALLSSIARLCSRVNVMYNVRVFGKEYSIMTNKQKIYCALGAAMALLAVGTSAETTLDWRFDTSGRASAVVAPVSSSGVVSTGFETAFWDWADSNGISLSSCPGGLTIIIR